MKKFFGVFVSVLVLLLSVTPIQNIAYASTLNQKVGATVQIGKYTGKIISYKDLPTNVTPKTVKDMTEAEKVIDNVNKSMSLLSKNNFSKQKSLSLVQNNSITPLSSGSSRQDKVNGGPQAGTSFHAVVQYSYSGNIFTSCTSISSYLSGITADVSWSQTDSSYSIIDGGRTLATDIYGYLTTYLITPIGLVAINTQSESVYTEFYV